MGSKSVKSRFAIDVISLGSANHCERTVCVWWMSWNVSDVTGPVTRSFLGLQFRRMNFKGALAFSVAAMWHTCRKNAQMANTDYLKMEKWKHVPCLPLSQKLLEAPKRSFCPRTSGVGGVDGVDGSKLQCIQMTVAHQSHRKWQVVQKLCNAFMPAMMIFFENWRKWHD